MTGLPVAVKATAIAGEDMSKDQAVVLQQPVGLLPTAQEYRVYLELAKQFIESGFLPRAIKNPAQALAIMLTGREIGIPPMMALRMIHVIDGKPGMSAELQLARFKRAGHRFKWGKTDSTVAEILVCPKGDDAWTKFSFTMAEAKQAGVTGKDNWQKYPTAMLRARVATLAVRAVAPDVSAGFYDPDELGDDGPTGNEPDWPKPTTPERTDVEHVEHNVFTGAIENETPGHEIDDDPVLPIEPFMSKKIPLSDASVTLGAVLGFVWKAVEKRKEVEYAGLIHKAIAAVALKLQDATLDHLTKVREWIVGKPERENFFTETLGAVEARMEDLIDMKAKVEANLTKPEKQDVIDSGGVPVAIEASDEELAMLLEQERG